MNLLRLLIYSLILPMCVSLWAQTPQEYYGDMDVGIVEGQTSIELKTVNDVSIGHTKIKPWQSSHESIFDGPGTALRAHTYINEDPNVEAIISNGDKRNGDSRITKNAPVSVQIFLEGPYMIRGTMSTKLNRHHLLPGQNKDLSRSLAVRIKATYTSFGHPYAVAPWQFTDNLGKQFGEASSPGAPAGVVSYDSDVTDWVLVTVRKNGIMPADDIWRCAGWLHSNGEVSFPEACSDLQVDERSDYYIMVEHRNHLAVLSPQPVIIVNGKLRWDFTQTDSYIKGRGRVGQKQVKSGVWAMCAANGNVMNSMTSISADDREGWRKEQNVINYCSGDFNLNAMVNSEDETIWKRNQNKSSSVAF